jgi:trehalose 6-phosphate phosphatase
MSDASSLPPPPSLASLGDLALFLDFDGTLVPIAEEPGVIAVPEQLAIRLERLSQRLDGRLAVVSGRSIADLSGHVGAVRIYRAGSHGAHVMNRDGSDLREARAIPEEAKALLEEYAAENDLFFENKPHGAGLHSRKVPARFDAMTAFGLEIARRFEMDHKIGKQVFELVHPGANKRSAVELLMEQAAFTDARPVFIGDDVTDEDGFAACEEMGGFGIAVGERPSDNARYHLDGVDAVYQWLDL